MMRRFTNANMRSAMVADLAIEVRQRLPSLTGMPTRQPHADRRHGTTTLFAMLSKLDGKIAGSCMERQSHQEFVKLLKRLEKETDALPVTLLFEMNICVAC
jgi:hypothetical protein